MNKKIVIAGAGSIGCFVGGLLLAAGRNVHFLGRERIAKQLSQHGLSLTDYTGMHVKVPAQGIKISTDTSVFSDAELILVCVKSGATATMAKIIRKHANPEAIVASLQNGLNNANLLRENLPGHDVRAGMVPFNVVQLGDGQFHRGTSGDIVVQQGEPDIATTLNVSNLLCTSSNDMDAVLCGKLLLNLNNALNALSDLPLVEQLSQRPWRVRMAEQIEEALAVFKAAGITPKPPSPVPAWLLPHILRLPTPVFKAVAKRMLAMDPTARTSMWQDLHQGRKTEIDELQGEIIRLAERHGLAAPHNQIALDQIKEAESKAVINHHSELGK